VICKIESTPTVFQKTLAKIDNKKEPILSIFGWESSKIDYFHINISLPEIPYCVSQVIVSTRFEIQQVAVDDSQFSHGQFFFFDPVLVTLTNDYISPLESVNDMVN